MTSIRVLTREEKETLVLRLEAGEAVLSLAKEAGVLRKSLYEWRAWYRLEGTAVGQSHLLTSRHRQPARGKDDLEAELAIAQSRIAELERLVGRQQADLHFFREALRSWDETRPLNGAPSSSRSSKK